MFNERLKKIRESHNMSQTELAHKLCVSKQSVSNWENDNIQPSIEILVKLARFFSVSTDYLLGLDNKKYIEVTNLSSIQIAHIQLIINDIAQK